MNKHLVLLALPALVACGEPVALEVTGVTPLPLIEGVDDASITGVTVDPDTGRRFVLTEFNGIFEVGDGISHLIREFPQPDVWPRAGWTDFASLGGDRFAITNEGDGYILDLGQQTLRQHFCYEPGWDGDWVEDRIQRTSSVAFDPGSDRLFAQPQTVEDGVVTEALVGSWDATSGVDLAWRTLPDLDFVAGGAAVAPDGTLYLARGRTLFTYDFDEDELIELGHLGDAGISDVQGMAWDAANERLLVLDDADDDLVELKLN